MTPPIVYQPTPSNSYRYYGNKPHRGLYFHHTATPQSSPTPLPTSNGSWHKLIAPDGTIHVAVPDNAAAFCVLKTDIFIPQWQVRCPDRMVSDANYSSDNWEIQYAPQAPYYESPTSEQYNTVSFLLREHYALYGATPVLGHGQVQSDKLATEPTYFDYRRVGLGAYVPYVGRFLLEPTSEEHMNPVDDQTIKDNLEQFGVGINPDTAIMQFVYRAYRAGDPPFGNWRGPALPGPNGEPGEYASAAPDGNPSVRHRFSGGIVEYNTVTGGIGWTEIVKDHPELS